VIKLSEPARLSWPIAQFHPKISGESPQDLPPNPLRSPSSISPLHEHSNSTSLKQRFRQTRRMLAGELARLISFCQPGKAAHFFTSAPEKRGKKGTLCGGARGDCCQRERERERAQCNRCLWLWATRVDWKSLPKSVGGRRKTKGGRKKLLRGKSGGCRLARDCESFSCLRFCAPSPESSSREWLKVLG